jgi:radical SAM superfamily enzyme YgiQ (UPF0313 family)
MESLQAAHQIIGVMRISFIDNFPINFGYAYLASILKSAGHTVIHHKYTFPKHKGADIFLSPEKYFAFDRIAEKSVDEEPDAICFSVMSTNYVFFKNLSREIKRRSNIPVIAGGVFCSLRPDLFIPGTGCDCIVLGESEKTIIRLVETIIRNDHSYIMKDIPGIMFRQDDGTIYRNPESSFEKDLDKLPYPDRSLFGDTKGSLYMLTSRGCFHPCTYCCASRINRLHHIKGLRKRSVDSVINELLYEISQKKYDRIFFYDDLFIINEEWFDEFSLKYEKEVGLPYYCSVNAGMISENVARLLKRSHAREVQIGVQSVNEVYKAEVLKRKESNTSIVKAVEILKRNKIRVLVDFIFGLPGESEEDLVGAVEFVNDHRPSSVQVNFLCYYPGSELAKLAFESELISKEIYAKAERNELIGEQSYMGGSHSEHHKKLAVKFAILMKLATLLPNIVISFLLRIKVVKRLPVNRWLYYFISVLVEVIGGNRDYLNIIRFLSFSRGEK